MPRSLSSAQACGITYLYVVRQLRRTEKKILRNCRWDTTKGTGNGLRVDVLINPSRGKVWYPGKKGLGDLVLYRAQFPYSQLEIADRGLFGSDSKS